MLKNNRLDFLFLFPAQHSNTSPSVVAESHPHHHRALCIWNAIVWVAFLSQIVQPRSLSVRTIQVKLFRIWEICFFSLFFVETNKIVSPFLTLRLMLSVIQGVRKGISVGRMVFFQKIWSICSDSDIKIELFSYFTIAIFTFELIFMDKAFLSRWTFGRSTRGFSLLSVI